MNVHAGKWRVWSCNRGILLNKPRAFFAGSRLPTEALLSVFERWGQQIGTRPLLPWMLVPLGCHLRHQVYLSQDFCEEIWAKGTFCFRAPSSPPA